MTDDQIKAIATHAAEAKARAELAMPAPWHACAANDGECTCGNVWCTPADDLMFSVAAEGPNGCKFSQMPTARFIAAARTTVPALAGNVEALVAEVERLTAELAEARAALTESDDRDICESCGERIDEGDGAYGRGAACAFHRACVLTEAICFTCPTCHGPILELPSVPQPRPEAIIEHHDCMMHSRGSRWAMPAEEPT